MEHEHREATALLAQMREITRDYVPAGYACANFRAVFHSLEELEADLLEHIRLENDFLHPRAVELEQRMLAQSAAALTLKWGPVLEADQAPMRRRHFLLLTSSAAALAMAQPAASTAQIHSPTGHRSQSHPLPAWYDDAKFGIFIHWGLYSVPAWAEPSGELGKVDPAKWFYHNPYAEWYLNSIRLKESGAYKHHVATYGADFDYYRFGKLFEEQNRKWKAGRAGRRCSSSPARATPC